jgi:hypothetical protein
MSHKNISILTFKFGLDCKWESFTK